MTPFKTIHAVMAAAGLALLVLLAADALCGERPASLKGRSCSEAGCHDDLKKGKFIHGPVAIDSCSSCHTLRNEAKHKFAMARPSEELCSACHMKVVRRKVKHFPAEAGECVACHDPHHASNAQLLLKDEPGEVCMECHDDVLEVDGKKALHTPVEQKMCMVCHEAHDSDFAKLLKDGERDTCTFCHDEVSTDPKKHKSVHKPVKDGCVACHRGHSSANPKLLAAAQPALCYKCHEEKKTAAEQKANTHETALKGHGCGKCHAPHASQVAALGTKPHIDLCMDCHLGTMMHDGKAIPNIRISIARPEFKHGPVKEGTCDDCHDVHGDQKPRLLARNYTSDFYASFKLEEYDLCFGCHKKELALAADTEKATNFRNGSRNLHFLHVNKRRKGRTCRACHATHATNLPKMMRKTVPFGEWSLPIGFEQTENGGTCKSGCHLVKEYNRVEPINYSKPLAPAPEKNEGAGDEPAAEEKTDL